MVNVHPWRNGSFWLWCTPSPFRSWNLKMHTCTRAPPPGVGVGVGVKVGVGVGVFVGVGVLTGMVAGLPPRVGFGVGVGVFLMGVGGGQSVGGVGVAVVFGGTTVMGTVVWPIATVATAVACGVCPAPPEPPPLGQHAAATRLPARSRTLTSVVVGVLPAMSGSPFRECCLHTKQPTSSTGRQRTPYSFQTRGLLTPRTGAPGCPLAVDEWGISSFPYLACSRPRGCRSRGRAA